jgi:hypothetical protein
VAAFDIETDGLDWKNGDEIRMISITCENRDFLLTRHPITETPAPNYCVVNCDDEADLIRKFVDVVRQLKPLFLTGWNSMAFDTEFIFERASKHPRERRLILIQPSNYRSEGPVLRNLRVLDVSSNTLIAPQNDIRPLHLLEELYIDLVTHEDDKYNYIPFSVTTLSWCRVPSRGRHTMVDTHITEQGVASLQHIDYHLVNDSTIDHLHRQIDDLLAKL